MTDKLDLISNSIKAINDQLLSVSDTLTDQVWSMSVKMADVSEKLGQVYARTSYLPTKDDVNEMVKFEVAVHTDACTIKNNNQLKKMGLRIKLLLGLLTFFGGIATALIVALL